MDADGYPDDEELKRIEEWPYQDLRAMLDFVKERWKYADYGYWDEEEGKAHVSTAGWSGNESLLGAMKQNRMFWAICWEQSRRGGHYIFDLARMPVSE